MEGGGRRGFKMPGFGIEACRTDRTHNRDGSYCHNAAEFGVQLSLRLSNTSQRRHVY